MLSFSVGSRLVLLSVLSRVCHSVRFRPAFPYSLCIRRKMPPRGNACILALLWSPHAAESIMGVDGTVYTGEAFRDSGGRKERNKTSVVERKRKKETKEIALLTQSLATSSTRSLHIDSRWYHHKIVQTVLRKTNPRCLSIQTKKHLASRYSVLPAHQFSEPSRLTLNPRGRL